MKDRVSKRLRSTNVSLLDLAVGYAKEGWRVFPVDQNDLPAKRVGFGKLKNRKFGYYWGTSNPVLIRKELAGSERFAITRGFDIHRNGKYIVVTGNKARIVKVVRGNPEL